MSHEDDDDRDQLHFAAQRGDLGEVKRLSAQIDNISEFDELGYTPLHYAAMEDRIEVVRLLIARGADVNARHEPTAGDTPLAAVAGRCSLEMARLLVEAGADPTIRGGMGLNALDRAETRKRGDGPSVYRLLTRVASR